MPATQPSGLCAKQTESSRSSPLLRFNHKLQPILRMSPKDYAAAELEHDEEIGFVKLPAGDEAAEVMEPGEEAVDFPAAAVATQFTTVLCVLPAAIALVRRNQAYAIFPSQALIQGIGGSPSASLRVNKLPHSIVGRFRKGRGGGRSMLRPYTVWLRQRPFGQLPSAASPRLRSLQVAAATSGQFTAEQRSEGSRR